MLERTAAANDRHDSVRDPYQTIDLSGLTPLLPYDLVVDFDPVEKRQPGLEHKLCCMPRNDLNSS